MKIKHISTFQELLAYLVINNQLSADEAISTSKSGNIGGAPTLGALAYLLLGLEDSDLILKTFPLKFITSVDILDDEIKNPLLWPVQLLDVAVVDLDAFR
jgi:hypothetical protein